jgi:hypothetical protein
MEMILNSSDKVKKNGKKGRPSGYNIQNILSITKVLLENPEGLWLRKIAKKANLHPNTVSNYLNTVLSPLVEDISLGDDEKPIIRVIRLKPSVYKKIKEGANIQEILKFSRIIKNIE